MIKLTDLLKESINEIKNGRIGDYFMQKAGSDTINYGVIVDELANGAFKVVMFPVRNGKMTGKAKTASTKGWYPEPKKISKDEVPSKVLLKIEKKSKKYESVSESKYRGNVFADVVRDIVEDENFKHVRQVTEDGISNSVYIYLSTRDVKVANNIIDILESKYGIERATYSSTQVAVVVPSGALVEVTEGNSRTYFQTFSDAVQHAAEQAEKQGYQIDEDEWFSQIGTGGSYTRSRPSKGDTHRFTVGLLKRGKPARKALHIQVFGMDNGKYELNSYIN